MRSEGLDRRIPRSALLSSFIFTNEFQLLVAHNWNNYNDVRIGNLQIISRPFRVCKISNFISSNQYVEAIKRELRDVTYAVTFNDLSHFKQTNDFADYSQEFLKLLYHVMQFEVKKWMETITRIKLNQKVSMSSSSYENSDYLLCHDDNVRDRRIAFILYLCEDWTREDGGTLDLFDTDNDGLPRNVVKSLIPEYNSLIFFEVTDRSYHQVAEVLSHNKARLSINGWFHGPLGKVVRPTILKIQLNYLKPLYLEVNLNDWVNELYMKPVVINQVNKEMEAKSIVQLSDFLRDRAYRDLTEDLKSDTIVWRKVGPPNVRNYEVADEETLPESLKNLCNLFKSTMMLELLKAFTHLDLVKNRKKGIKNPKLVMELQRWKSGCYTTIYDPVHSEESSSDKTCRSSPEEMQHSMDNETHEGDSEMMCKSRYKGKDTLDRRTSTSPLADDEMYETDLETGNSSSNDDKKKNTSDLKTSTSSLADDNIYEGDKSNSEDQTKNTPGQSASTSSLAGDEQYVHTSKMSDKNSSKIPRKRTGVPDKQLYRKPFKRKLKNQKNLLEEDNFSQPSTSRDHHESNEDSDPKEKRMLLEYYKEVGREKFQLTYFRRLPEFKHLNWPLKYGPEQQSPSSENDSTNELPKDVMITSDVSSVEDYLTQDSSSAEENSSVSIGDKTSPKKRRKNLSAEEQQNLPEEEQENLSEEEQENLPQEEQENLPQEEQENLPQEEQENLSEEEQENWSKEVQENLSEEEQENWSEEVQENWSEEVQENFSEEEQENWSEEEQENLPQEEQENLSEEEQENELGTLDAIIQFCVGDCKNDKSTIYYVDPTDRDGHLVDVPAKENHLCLVFTLPGVSRVHSYLNQNYSDYFYNLICTYHEQSY